MKNSLKDFNPAPWIVKIFVLANLLMTVFMLLIIHFSVL